MNTKFKGGQVVYTIKDEDIEWDEVQSRYCNCYKLDILGWVDKELLEPSVEVLSSTEVACKLSGCLSGQKEQSAKL